MTLTPTAIQQLDNLARQYGVSRSEVVEGIARGEIRDIPHAEAGELKPDEVGNELDSYAEGRYSVEISAHLQTVPLRCRERIPSCQGAYAVFALDWQGVVYSCISKDIKADLEADLQSKPELQELLVSPDVYAWIVWGRCSNKSLLGNMQQNVIQLCKEWLTDETSIVIYDSEYDCELGWCEQPDCSLGFLPTEDFPHSVKAVNP